MGISIESGSAEAMRGTLVDALRRHGLVQGEAVDGALRAVPRHLFVPGVPLARAYGHEAVVTYRDESGAALSSLSEPGLVAAMLEQLDVRPGHRVLEVGTGTGYNAALLSRLTGPQGHVTSVDILPGAVAVARRGLARAGYAHVETVVADGRLGHPDGAPYDRIIVTGGAWDLPAAWAEQLAPGGVLVVPLRLRGVTRSVAFTRRDGVWTGHGALSCGFVPLRGDDEVAEHQVVLGDPPVLRIRADEDRALDEAVLQRALDRSETLVWTGVRPPGGENHLDFGLAALPECCRVMPDLDAVRSGAFTAALYPWGSMGAATGDTFAYLARRGIGDTAEIGVSARGPASADLVARLADLVRAWDRTRHHVLRIDAHPRGAAPSDATWTVPKRRTTVAVHLDPPDPTPLPSRSALVPPARAPR
ncbi:methyltransferase, FxLD system [Actinocorallia herbida]|uniref:methyltransferase, FxLD system n=1 Tax=Actinocorallia herbida TaxID=58109 RepID=UPI0014771170|nr:methyltransferase, FxLD system [Actinocorallia herbida]